MKRIVAAGGPDNVTVMTLDDDPRQQDEHPT